MSYNFQIRKTYNFEVYPSTILGNDFKNVTVLGILDRETAETLTNVTTKHPLIYPYLPSGTPNDPQDYTYLKIKHQTGEITAIAVEWIQESTIELVNASTYMVRIPNLAGSQVALLRQALAENGFTGFQITRVEN